MTTKSNRILDETDEDAEAHAIAEAEAEIDAGKGILHDKVREWLQRLAEGEMLPPPCE
jgi:predicted transcriptional regulator